MISLVAKWREKIWNRNSNIDQLLMCRFLLGKDDRQPGRQKEDMSYLSDIYATTFERTNSYVIVATTRTIANRAVSKPLQPFTKNSTSSRSLRLGANDGRRESKGQEMPRF